MVEEETADFLYLRLRHPDFVGFLSHDGMTGSDLPHITGTGVSEFPVPLPPIDEQREIVQRAFGLLRVADSVVGKLSEAGSRISELGQGILSKAFRGHLVATEAELAREEGRDYEPAAALLERIRAERKVQANSGVGKGRVAFCYLSRTCGKGTFPEVWQHSPPSLIADS